MKITKNINLTDFKFWSGAKEHNFNRLELENLDNILTDIYKNEATETDINDLFWFEEEFLCELLGIEFKQYLKR